MASFALLGSGEFEPWTEPVDRWLLEHGSGDGRVVVLPDRQRAGGRRGVRGLGLDGAAALRAKPASRRRSSRFGRGPTPSGRSWSPRCGARPPCSSPAGTPRTWPRRSPGTPAWEASLRRDATRHGVRGLQRRSGVPGRVGAGQLDPGPAQRRRLGCCSRAWACSRARSSMPHWDALDGYVPGLRASSGARCRADRRLRHDRRAHGDARRRRARGRSWGPARRRHPRRRRAESSRRERRSPNR